MPGAGPAMRRKLSGSLVPSSSLQGSLSKDITPSRKKLIDQGVHLILDNIIKDLQAEALTQQLIALRALQGLTRSRGSTEAIQGRFREDGGLPLLVAIISATTSSSSSEECGEANAGATEALFFLTRNNAESRGEAVKVGAVAALAGSLGSGNNLPPTVFTLRALHSLLSPDPTGDAASELFAAGGVHALVELLSQLVEAEQMEDREAWTQEVLALLEPAAGRSPRVASFLAGAASVVSHLLMVSTAPLTLSLGLDILEEVLANGEAQHSTWLLAEQGAIAALLHAVRLKGLGSKAAQTLARLVSRDPLLLGTLAGLLRPEDVAALVSTTAAAARAEDVEAAAPAGLLAKLLAPAGMKQGSANQAPITLRAIYMARSTGACLAMESIRQPLLTAAGSPVGGLVLRNLPATHSAEAAIAASHLLPSLPSARQVLRRPAAIPMLVAAFLDEHTEPDADASASLEATGGVTQLLRTLPQPAEASEAAAAPRPNPPPEPAANGGSYASVTFHVAGHEYVALGWALQNASPAIARTLAAIPDASSAAVVIPDVPGIAPERLYRLFGAAVDFATSGNLAIDDSDALDLWAIAAVLQMEKLMHQCEQLSAARLLGVPARLQHALELASRYPTAGERLALLSCSHLARRLVQNESGSQTHGQLRSLLGSCRDSLQHGFELLLKQRLSHAGQPCAEVAPGSLDNTPHANEAADLGSCSIGSFKEWVGSGNPSRASSLNRPSGSLAFPTGGSLSEIEPLPESPPRRRR